MEIVGGADLEDDRNDDTDAWEDSHEDPESSLGEGSGGSSLFQGRDLLGVSAIGEERIENPNLIA